VRGAGRSPTALGWPAFPRSPPVLAHWPASGRSLLRLGTRPSASAPLIASSAMTSTPGSRRRSPTTMEPVNSTILSAVVAAQINSATRGRAAARRRPRPAAKNRGGEQQPGACISAARRRTEHAGLLVQCECSVTRSHPDPGDSAGGRWVPSAGANTGWPKPESPRSPGERPPTEARPRPALSRLVHQIDSVGLAVGVQAMAGHAVRRAVDRAPPPGHWHGHLSRGAPQRAQTQIQRHADREGSQPHPLGPTRGRLSRR
jgi:hypothetical protein